MNNNEFEYKYVAPTSEERKEIERIRSNYIVKDKSSNKLETLRKLDNKVKNIPVTISITMGIIFTLVFGLGMAMVLEWGLMIGGLIVSCIGLIMMIFTYPLHLKIAKYVKTKYSKEIIKLSEELLNDEK
ncbi:MAG: hypothetical protein IJ371_04405 [Clostridia bacterium]|nr:hypothetical protein [Clostridia bacterium]